MRIEHSFDIYAKLCMPTNHFEFYVSFFFYVLVTCWVLWCVVYVILHCGKLSVRLSVCPSLCEHVSSPITLVLYQMIRNTYCLWLPNFQGHIANFKVNDKTWWYGSNSGFSGIFLLVAPKFPRLYGKFQGQWQNLVKRVKFRVFGYFLENAWGERPEIPYAAVSWPPNYILITVCWFY